MLREYVDYYNEARPHRSLDLQPPAGSRLELAVVEWRVVRRGSYSVSRLIKRESLAQILVQATVEVRRRAAEVRLDYSESGAAQR